MQRRLIEVTLYKTQVLKVQVPTDVDSRSQAEDQARDAVRKVFIDKLWGADMGMAVTSSSEPRYMLGDVIVTEDVVAVD